MLARIRAAPQVAEALLDSAYVVMRRVVERSFRDAVSEHLGQARRDGRSLSRHCPVRSTEHP